MSSGFLISVYIISTIVNHTLNVIFVSQTPHTVRKTTYEAVYLKWLLGSLLRSAPPMIGQNGLVEPGDEQCMDRYNKQIAILHAIMRQSSSSNTNEMALPASSYVFKLA